MVVTKSGLRAMARALVSEFQPGMAVFLMGEMGAGKTAFTQYLARYLGVQSAITSPTFVVKNHYQGRIPMVHIDFYRLSSDLIDIDEWISPEDRAGAIVVIEWADRLRDHGFTRWVSVAMKIESKTTRTIDVQSSHGLPEFFCNW